MKSLLPADILQTLNSVPSIIVKAFPIPARFRGSLPSSIAELSKLLTSKRGDRSLSYLGRPNLLSAYMHYFLPWNLYRLCLLLHDLDIKLKEGGIITDIGSGPLTFVSALWISRPDLRNSKLEINCIDRSAPAMEAGKRFFSVLAENCPWKINLLREDIDIRRTEINRIKKQSNLVCAVNIFNEVYENLPHTDTEGLKRIAANAAKLMHNLALPDAFILTVEPGIPQSGKFISFLRTAFIELGRLPAAPCTHTEACPLSGRQGAKKKWCHFAFETFDAPKELHRLSAAARLPKERLVLSYLLTGGEKTGTIQQTRVISDAFSLPQGRFGRYGCCAQGLVLLAGEKKLIEKTASGSLVSTPVSPSNEHDAKSGAIIVYLKSEKEGK